MICFDEMSGTDGALRDAYLEVENWLRHETPESLTRKRQEADTIFRRLGITFVVYGDGGSAERLIPFDILPRVLTGAEWDIIERGCIQRVMALNAFLADVYHEGEIVKAGLIPDELVYQNPLYLPEVHGIRLPHGIHSHISGIDVVRTGPEEFFVLEDNLRTPSGVSYMMEGRNVMMRLFPDLFSKLRVRPVEQYGEILLQNLRDVAPEGSNDPTIVVLTPGRYNSAYFEHVFLAEQMGVLLVEGQDLFVEDGRVLMRTTGGPHQVDVIYKRLDDDFMDPLAFRADSSLGIPGILSVVREGRVTLANALGNGVADDKGIYPFVPDMIQFYLGEKPILGNVQTWKLRDKDDLAYALDHLEELVVKEVRGSGGYGMLVGPTSTKEERDAYRERILQDPSDFIAQPTLALSTCPTFVETGVAPRHVDLRPFVLAGKTTSLVPGAFTRVALRDGSLVVNSSQGGGTKDTWVLK
jgi:uncharacterized circularly permuted ATP-grasp superfamily protein